MYQINLKTQVLSFGVKVTKEEKKTLVDDFYDFEEALTYLNQIYFKLSYQLIDYEFGFKAIEYEIKSITRKSNGSLIVRYIDKNGKDKRRIYTIVKQR